VKIDETKVEKNYFNKIFLGVLILHIIFLYIIPGFSKIEIKKPKVNTIAIGIVNQDIESAPEKKEIVSKENQEKKVEKEEAKEEIAKKEVEKPKKKVLTTTQSFEELDLMAIEDSPREIPKKGPKEKPDIIKIEDKEMITTEEVELNNVEEENDLDVNKNIEEVEALDIDTEIDSNSIVVDNTEENIEDTQWDNLFVSDNPSVIGPKTGVKVGSVDGESTVVWDPANKEPEYPIEAEKNAQTADVKIILNVDESGKVLKVKITKTGVDVIDRAVESVARSWNVKLINNGMSISGSIVVVYQFKLKGRE